MRIFIPLFIVFTQAGSLYCQSSKTGDFIDSYAKEHNFNGTVLVRKDTNTVYHKSFGLANRQFNVPTNNETKYRIASITKLFTSVLIMQLYDQQRIDLNKPIKTYLPDYTGDGADKVSIHQLLNHTSGMPNFDVVKTMEDALINGIPYYQRPHTTDELLKNYCSGNLINEPGKTFDYNNADYIILGKIIERIYGQTYDEVLKQHILEPLEMENSGMTYQYNVLESLASGYFYRDDLKQIVNDLPIYIENWYAAGAMYSTTRDILKFSNSLFGLKILKKETLDMLIKPGLEEYGYGVWVYDFEINKTKHKVIKRPGSIMGAQAMFLHFIDEDVTIIILSNTATISLDDFADEISTQVLKQT